jgi:hypothetical protein
MRSGTWLGLAAVGALAACSSLPWMDYGEPPPECNDVFAADQRLVWAGRADPFALGVMVEHFQGRPPRAGDIFVGQPAATLGFAGPGTRAACIVFEDSILVGPVPDGWRPP